MNFRQGVIKINTVFLNPPVYASNYNSYFTDSNDFYTYLINNPDHRIETKVYRSNYLSSKHVYKDKLVINQVWKSPKGKSLKWIKDRQQIHSIKDLIQLKNNGVIDLVHADIWEYSKKRSQRDYSPEKGKEYLYEVLEYQVEEPTTIPDEEFDKLLTFINNTIKFQDYLSKRNNDN